MDIGLSLHPKNCAIGGNLMLYEFTKQKEIIIHREQACSKFDF